MKVLDVIKFRVLAVGTLGDWVGGQNKNIEKAGKSMGEIWNTMQTRITLKVIYDIFILI